MVKAHPEKRAEDLLAAFRDPEIDMILCAIGGDDTYRLLPYLFDRNELADAVSYDKFQFVRNGFFCVDSKDSKPGAPVFNRIVSLKSSFVLPKNN